MNIDHDRSPSQDRIVQLFSASADGWLDSREREELIELLRRDPEARAAYIEQAMLHSLLFHKARSGEAMSPLLSDASPATPAVDESTTGILGFLGETWQGSLDGLSRYPMLSGYLAATVLLCVVVFVASLIKISHVGLVERAAPKIVTTDPFKAFHVARITALADCRWKQWSVVSGQWSVKDKSANISIPVSLGDRFALTSGFMEITYDTGAKVILEGPCTYEIESSRGGFLAIGRLTALVEKGEGRRVKGEKEADSRLSTLDSGLFAVRTPTAIVTDLGTEFGVEVEKSGATRSHVFQGRIELRPQEDSRGLTAPGEPPVDHVVQLTAGESARVERGRNRAVAIVREPGQPKRFVRRMPRGQVQGPESRVQSQNRQLGDSRLSTLAPRPSSLSYRLTDLGTLGGKTSRAMAINAAGQVVGEAATISGVKRAFLYVDGKMKDLGSVSDGNSFAFDINTLGQVVGGSYGKRTGRSFAFLYSDGRMWDLGTLGGTSSAAFAMNDAGQIVGSARNSSGRMRAFLYTRSAGMRQIASSDNPKAKSWASDINAVGQVVGRWKTGDLTRAFLYTPKAGIKDLGAFGGRRCLACRINDAGQVVGAADVHNGSHHAFLYDKNTGMKDLGTLNGPNSGARAINNFGQVVGYADYVGRGTGRTHAFLYHDGKMIDLNALIDPTAGWTLSEASGINDFGLIVGKGIATDGNTRAFLLTPINGTGAGSR